MKKFSVLCAALAAISIAHAAPVFFRSGRILCAEISRVRPYGFKRLCASEPPSRPVVYAAVTIKLDKGRKIGIFDYSLRAGRRKYECAMIRDNSTGDISDISGGGEKRRCTLFFELDGSAVKGGGKARLVCNAPGRGEVVIVFADRGSGDFTPDAEIPEPAPADTGK